MSQTNDRDQFGHKGDFITSPEISQIFGELLGIWTVTEWMAQGQSSRGIDLIELGPGRGTLMDDMLRTLRNFKALASNIKTIYLVETSPSLRETQKRLLCGNDAIMEETDMGIRSTSKCFDVPVVWCEDIRFVPKDTDNTPFIFAHEFFDALPIHAFQSVAPAATSDDPPTIPSRTGPATLRKPAASTIPQWRELVISPTPDAPQLPTHNATNNSTTATSPSTSSAPPPPEFQLSLAAASNPNSLVLPEISPRYRALKPHAGSTIEICPEARTYAEEIARRIAPAPTPSPSSPNAPHHQDPTRPRPSGAALIIDYGPPAPTIPANSLRGIRAHRPVSPLSSPGLVDLSADVDFTALAEAAINASPGVEVHGPVEQGRFLEALGGWERVKQLVGKEGDAEKRERLEGGWRRLVERGGEGMGGVYKVLAIVPESGGRRRPVGFGGGVEF
ncbi:hypothetical protein MMC16_002179 [Acarospora aff. strigata]|nr:hypothetical protein [Acarospora aff. strigata]